MPVMNRSIHSSSGLPGQLPDSPVKSPDPLPRPPYHPIPTQPTPCHSLASKWYPYVTLSHLSHHTCPAQPVAPTLALNHSRRDHPLTPAYTCMMRTSMWSYGCMMC